MKLLWRKVARGLNRVLAGGGLRLDKLQRDFDDRPLDEFTRQRMLSEIGEAYSSWVTSQRFFNVADNYDASSASAQFFDLWLQTPFRHQRGGSRFNNLLWLHLIARSCRPDFIVDSGTFEGASAWALATGSPRSRVLSFDVDLSQLALRTPGVVYIGADWTSHSIAKEKGEMLLAYFDDHVDQIRRVIEASDRGCHVAIFDDDFPVTSYYAMAPNPGVLPKIEFALDDTLRDGQTLKWVTAGSIQSFTIDRSYLDRGRARIATTGRLPNTSLVTGIHQTPYRIVALSSSINSP